MTGCGHDLRVATTGYLNDEFCICDRSIRGCRVHQHRRTQSKIIPVFNGLNISRSVAEYRSASSTLTVRFPIAHHPLIQIHLPQPNPSPNINFGRVSPS